MTIKIRPMEMYDVDTVYEIEEESFDSPWSKVSLKNELSNNPFAHYRVLIQGDSIVGFYGLWKVIDEGHLLNIAVAKDHRSKGFANILMDHMIHEEKSQGLSKILLEVRRSNQVAIQLYKKYGFRCSGIRQDYYHHPKEDAILMELELGSDQ